MRLGVVAEEELAAASVFTSVGHGKAAGLVLTAVDFAIDFVARTASARHPLCPFPGVWAAALGHETVDYPVKGKAVVEALIGQFHKVGHGVGGVGVKQIDHHGAGFGIHHGFGHRCTGKVEDLNLGTKP